MSEDEKGFLARWSQRKRDAGKAEPVPAPPGEPAQPAGAAPEATAGEAEPPIDLESLPKLEEITAGTDMTVFFRKGVPEAIRNAALRKSWALDPAIRNYVNPALDYAYDWNTPGGVPGAGELSPGTDIARMVSQIMGGAEPEAVDKARLAETYRRDEKSDHAAGHQADAELPAPSVRLSEVPLTTTEQHSDATSVRSQAVDSDPEQDESQARTRTSASQQAMHRHGSARPK
jgi:hypothetical protein